MRKRKRSKAPYVVLLLLAAAIAGLLFYILPYRYHLNRTVRLEESAEALDNPLTGYAPRAEDVEACRDAGLVYINLTWEQWEPSQGQYDIQGLEERCHISRWKEAQKHAVLRFVCDVPGEAGHRDIPQWLYDKTRDGTEYSGEYGAGYSPDYENEFFRECHAAAVQALAEYCNRDDFVAYVELGSLGHWGEWHTALTEDNASFPDAEICWDYVLDYTDHFHNARLLMRRNFVMAAQGGLGLYNDMTGDADSTREWLGWISSGGSMETSGRALECEPMEDFWKSAPAGGEFTSGEPMETLLGEKWKQTLELVRDSHMTFIGPNCPTGGLSESHAAEALREALGYRFYISELQTQYSFAEDQLKVTLTWENTGIAPLYWDWPVTLYVFNPEGELKYWESVDLNLSELVPGETKESVSGIPLTEEFRNGYQIGIGIESPDGDERIRLAMDAEELDEAQVIYTYGGE